MNDIGILLCLLLTYYHYKLEENILITNSFCFITTINNLYDYDFI